MPRIDNPTIDEIINWRTKYIEALQGCVLADSLWDTYKDEFMPARFDEMRVVD